MNKDRRNKGFTMIEIIAVLVILVLVAAVGIPSVDAYIENSEQQARMDTARTIFLAAQTALTQKYLQDSRYGETGASAAIEKPETIWTNMTDRQKKQADKLQYYTFGMHKGAPGSDLYDLIAPYLNDKNVLSGAILLEYNRASGNALSVFYKEADDGAGFSANGLTSFTFGYGDGASYNVYNRSSQALTNGKVGFFGVDSVGDPIVTAPIQPVKVTIKDYTAPLDFCYGLLVADCALPSVQRSSFVYTLKLESGGGAETLTVGETEGDGDIWMDDIALEVGVALENPHQVEIDGVDRNVVLWKDAGQGGGTVLHFVIDGVYDSLGIYRNYPALKPGYLSANFSATDGVNAVSADSNMDEHSYFDDEDGSNGYTVSSVRHLNNVRYRNEADAIFRQTQTIYMVNYQGRQGRTPVTFAPLCNADDPRPAFAGTYVNEKIKEPGEAAQTAPAIVDLVVQNAARGGLFDTVASKAHVTGVRLLYESVDCMRQQDAATAISGGSCAGGIAGINNGTIADCFVTGHILAANGDAGGVAGVNDGVIQTCFVAADVRGKTNAGGVAGLSTGRVAYCEVGTASRPLNSMKVVNGTPYYGARPPRAGDYKPGQATYASANNTFKVTLTGSNGASGGIVGTVSGTHQADMVTGCVNAAKINGNPLEDLESGSSTDIGDAGGIVGCLDVSGRGDAEDWEASVSRCYNAGAVYGAGGAGGLIGYIASGKLRACYNTGFVNRFVNIAGGTPPWGDPRNLNRTNHTSGGVVGSTGDKGNGKSSAIVDCYNMQYAGDAFGGAFGILRAGTNVQRCAFLGNTLNYKDTYKVQQGNGGNIKESDTGLRRRTSEQLRDSDSSRFTPGLFSYEGLDRTNPDGSPIGVGPFGYPYPYLNNDSVSGGLCALNRSFHRTPWTPVLESNRRGILRLSDVGGEMRIEIYALDNTEDVRLNLDVTWEGEVISRRKDSFQYTLTEEARRVLRSATGERVTVSDTVRIPVGLIRIPITLRITFLAMPLTTADPEYALGFRYVYWATVSWTGDWATSVKRLQFDGRLTGEGQTEPYDTDSVDRIAAFRTGAVSLGEASVITGATAESGRVSALKCAYVDIGMTRAGSCVVAILNEAGTEINRIPVNRSFLENNLQLSFDAAYDGTRINAITGDASYVLYQSPEDYYEYRLVLYSNADPPTGDYPDIAFSASHGVGLIPGQRYRVKIYVGDQDIATSGWLTAPGTP